MPVKIPSGQEPNAEGQAPGAIPQPQDAPAGQDPAAPTGGKTYDEEYVKGLRAEAAQHRTRARELEAAEAGRKAAQTKQEAEEAAKRGEYQRLHEQAKDQLSRLRQAHVALHVRLGLAQAGIDPEVAECVQVDTSGVTVDDEGHIQGPLAERVQQTAARFAKYRVLPAAAPAAPASNGGSAPKPPIVIADRPAQRPEADQPAGLAGVSKRFADDLRKTGLSLPELLRERSPAAE